MILENHSWVGDFVLVFTEITFIVHIDREVLYFINTVKQFKISLYELTKSVVVLRLLVIATFQHILWQILKKMVFSLGIWLDACHMIMFLLEFLDKFFVLEGSMVQRFFEILSVHILKDRHLV